MFAAKDTLLTRPSGDYQISRSVRLRSSASAYLNRTPASASNRKTWTWSGWVKRGTLGVTQWLFDADNGSTDSTEFNFAIGSGNTLLLGGSLTTWRVTTQVFRDPSAWYHIVLAIDTTQATANNRIRLYVNGSEVTAFSTLNNPTQNLDLAVNQAIAHYIGIRTGLTSPFDGYLTEINFIDGQALTPSSFGETNAITGVWQPKKYAGTYGTNGFYLNFSDNSAVTTSSNVGIGKDFSGNGNYWTSNSISITAGVTYDSMLDVPTLYADGGNGRGNYAVLSPVNPTANTPSDGNLRGVMGSSENGITSTMAIPSGMSAYWEVSSASTTSASIGCYAGVASLGVSMAQSASYNKTGVWAMTAVNIRQLYANGSAGSSVASTLASTSILQVAVDNTSSGSNTYIWIGVDNVFYNSTMGTTGNPSTGANPTFTISKQDLNAFFSGYLNTVYANFGQRPFTYTPPTGFVALNTQNLPTPTISNGASYMAATLYSGNSGTQSITNTVNGVSFQPDFVWGKSRNIAENHALFDIVRGVNKTLYANLTNAEATDPGVSAFNSNGFTLNGATINATGYTYVAWQWNAGGSTVTNTSGTISSQVRANPTAGFSVVTYTGTGANATVGHGLNAIPAMIMVKNRDSGAIGGAVYHTSMGATKYLKLFQTTTGSDQEATDNTAWNGGSPTFNSSVFSVGSLNRTNSSQQMVAYCFAAVAGYSAFGKYTGNGVPDGPFVFCGFRPRFVMIKRTDSANNWVMFDTSRDTYNAVVNTLSADSTNSEATFGAGYNIDFLSNGFKPRNTTGAENASGGTYIFMAFCENPFKLSLAR